MTAASVSIAAIAIALVAAGFEAAGWRRPAMVLGVVSVAVLVWATM